MRKSLVLAVMFTCLLLALPVAAQEPISTLFFPSVARLAGVPPSQWVTDLTVNNLMNASIIVGFQFFPEKTTHDLGDFTFTVRRTFAPRETKMFEDVLWSLFGYSTNIKGSILVTAENDMLGLKSNPADSSIVGTARTYDVSSPVGTYGQTVAPASFFDAASQLFITGAREDATYRSNLGLVNMSLEAVTIHYRIIAANATVVAEGAKGMGSLRYQQWSFENLGVNAKVAGPLTVDLWLDPADVTLPPCSEDWPNYFIAYVSKVDNRTQDAEMIYAMPAADLECDD